MGVNTTAILRKGLTIEEIEKAISKKYTDVEVTPSSVLNFMYVMFKDGKDKRQLAISFSNSCERDNGISGVWCSLGMWGNSFEIVRYLCETFGGYIDENDCDDEGYCPINFNLYSQGTEFTQLDLFKNKVIQKFGYKHLEDALSLLYEFKHIA